MHGGSRKMSKTKWSAEKTWKFVTEYRQRGCLWNTNLQSYKDRQLKDSAYVELAKMFGLGGVNDVKIKIKNLRTTYIQEHKKIQESIKANNNGNAEGVYVPSLVWYREMDSFLHYTSLGKIAPINALVSENKLGSNGDFHVKEEVLDFNSEKVELTNISDLPRHSYELRISKEIPQHLSKKRKQPESHSLQTTANSDLYFEEHEFDIFGRSVAKQLKSFSSIAAALRVQSKIQSLLTEERIQDQIAASGGNSQRPSSANQHFFYNQEPNSTATTEQISVLLPSTTRSISNESCASGSLVEDSKEFEVTFMN